MPITELGQRLDRAVLNYYNNSVSMGDALCELQTSLEVVAAGAGEDLQLREFAENAARLCEYMQTRFYTLEEAVLGYFAPDPRPIEEESNGKPHRG